MGSLYYTDAADLLRSAGLVVVECDGWKSRARSSGGFASAPLGCQWHNTASNTSPQNDTNYMFFNADDAPIGNALITREGEVWLGAAGAANTAGKGGPLTLSRGTVPLDSGNSTTWAWEVANDGVGGPWPEVQINAFFTATIVMNKRFGNRADDLFTHALGAGDGWTSRKIDPATAAAVQGPWKPRSVNSSGTWSQADIRAEINRRAGGGSTPPPTTTPPPSSSTYTVVSGDSWWGISEKLFVTMDQLLAANPPATTSTVIHPGQVLNVPGSVKPPPAGGVDWAAEGGNMTTPPGSPTLKRGVESDTVPWLQAVLSSMDTVETGEPIYNPAWVHYDHVGAGNVDSNLFGDATHNAVAYWQGKNGLTADGVYGTKTATKMAQVRGK